jgi:hypothetical protein
MPRSRRRWWPIAATAAALLTACVGETGPTTVATTRVPSATTTAPATEPPDPTTPELREPRRGASLPTERTEVAGTVWDGRIVVVGGLEGSGAASRRADVYDPASDEWAALPDLPEGLHHTALAVLGDRLYMVGGYGVGGPGWVARAEVWSLGPDDDAWRAGPPLQTPRGALAVASTGTALVAIGGVGPSGVLASTEILGADADAWVAGPGLAEAREHLAATAVGDAVYAIAGRVGGMGTNLATVEVLRDGAWVPAPPLIHPRGGIGAATVGETPCVAGGEEDTGTIGSVECLVEGEWAVVAVLEAPRHGLAVVAVDGWLHVIGGGPDPGLTVSGVHEIIPIGSS